jgi:DNA-directed RNA polymerase specialized sigma24 family protein
MSGLLLLAFSRGLKRRATKLSRFETVGGPSDLFNSRFDSYWSRRVDARIDLNRIVRKLSEKNSTVLVLRYAGYDWKEIAQVLGTSVTVIRNGFWREIGDVRKLLGIHGPLPELKLPRT